MIPQGSHSLCANLALSTSPELHLKKKKLKGKKQPNLHPEEEKTRRVLILHTVITTSFPSRTQVHGSRLNTAHGSGCWEHRDGETRACPAGCSVQDTPAG